MKAFRARLRWLGAAMAACALIGAHGTLRAQQLPIGSVSLEDATVVGAASTDNDRAMIVGNGTVTAKDHVAYVELYRGGSVKVCATSGLHLTSGAPEVAIAGAATTADATAAAEKPTDADAPPVSSSLPPLMLALDRGALEVHMNAIPSDVLMTPDLRFAFSEAGALDVRIRVTRDGDTCVENRVAGLANHPTLRVEGLFGTDTYNVLPGQHVLFERADLREVVDNESSPCGCPEQASVHDAGPTVDLSLKPGAKISSAQAEALHPFPAAVSQGLAPAPEVPQAPPGAVHTQVATALTYNGNAPSPAPAAEVPQTKPPRRGFFRTIGRFFKNAFS